MHDDPELNATPASLPLDQASSLPYRLYGANGSGAAIVEAALVELGVAFEWVAVDAARGAQREAAYAAVNPHRKLPTLVTPAGETLTETVAIVLTLAERHPAPALLPPPGSPQRAQALRWMLFAVSELYPLMELIDHPERFAPEDPAARSGLREQALEHWRARWRTVEAALGAGPYLLGAVFCAADLFLAVLSRWDLAPDWRAAHLPRVQRLALAVAARPALASRWPRHFPRG